MNAITSPQALSRRSFIRQASCAAVGTAVLSGTLRSLRLVNVASALTLPSDYKALVCIFLAGGNDANNLIVPTDSEYSSYAAARTSVLALPVSGAPYTLLPLKPLNNDGHTYGLHPGCPELQTLFAEGKLACIFNTGTLAFPLSRAQFLAHSVPAPAYLFSHADQQRQWQTSISDASSPTGWGGRCADLLAAAQPNAPISLCVTLETSNVFEVGNVVSQYALSTSGPGPLRWVSDKRLQALTNLFGLPYPNLQEQAFSKTALHSAGAGTLVNAAIQATADPYWTVPFPATVASPTGGPAFGSDLSAQLKLVARLIEAGQRSAANGGFGMKRQIFFCQQPGYDLHINQTSGPGASVTGSHANLLAELSQSLLAFQRGMEQLGLANNVAAFTMSEFGRTLPTNGQGSDHGWGAHHLVLGGAVNGQRTYGTFPTLAINGPDDCTGGNWIPTTAIDQYFATLATWFGVDTTNLSTVFPNLSRFATPNLGFI